MADSTADDRNGDDEPPIEAELGAAVDEAMEAERKRQFVQRIVGIDRGEGVGRGVEWRENFPDPGRDGPGDPAADPGGP